MEKRSLRRSLGMFVVVTALVIPAGCDSGEKARDELTGSRAVKQYHQSTKDIGKITDRQSEKFESIPEDEKQEGKKE